MRAPTRISMTSRVSRRRGTLRHLNSSIVRPPHPDLPLLLCNPVLTIFSLYFSHNSFLWLLACGCIVSYLFLAVIILFFPPCFVVLLNAVIHKSSLTLVTFCSYLLSTFSSLWLCSFHIQCNARALIFMLYHSSRASSA